MKTKSHVDTSTLTVMPPAPLSLPTEKMATAILDASASDKLQKETVGCRLRMQKLSLNRGFDAGTKTRIAAELGITKTRAVSGSHKIFDDSHPEIKKHNDLFNRVEAYWKGCSLPLAAAYSDDMVTEGGTRLLRRDKSEEFHQRMLAFRSEAVTVTASLNRERESILAAAREMLGQRYDERVYPQAFAIDVFWSFPNVEVPSYLAAMAPEAYEHERQLVAKRFETTYELATLTMLRELHAVMTKWAEVLGPRIMIRPPEGHPLHGYYGAEVAEVELHNNNPEVVPEGKKRYRLQHKDGNAGIWTEPMNQSEYEALQPYRSADSKRTFHVSTVENLQEMVSKFSVLGGLIHKTGQLDLQLKEMDALLGKFDGADAVAKELRNSTVFRDETHKWAAGIAEGLGTQIATFTASRCAITRRAPAAAV